MHKRQSTFCLHEAQALLITTAGVNFSVWAGGHVGCEVVPTRSSPQARLAHATPFVYATVRGELREGIHRRPSPHRHHGAAKLREQVPRELFRQA